MDSEYDDTVESEPTWSRRRSSAADDSPEGSWPGRGQIDGADRHKYQVLRAHFKEQCAARRAPCAFCNGEIRYSAPFGSPWSFEVNHNPPVSALVAAGTPERALDVACRAVAQPLQPPRSGR